MKKNMSTAPTFFFTADEHYGHTSIINSWQLYGHSHGKLPPIGKQWDIGVDNNNFYPVSFNKICEIMVARPDNPNFVKNNDA
jgi:calcineurin-like phosphoesterase family protein